jgi:hypothetical protein
MISSVKAPQIPWNDAHTNAARFIQFEPRAFFKDQAATFPILLPSRKTSAVSLRNDR